MAMNDEVKAALHGRVANDMKLHSVSDPDTAAALDHLRQRHTDLAHEVVDLTPVSREQSLALTALDEALHWSIAAIVRHQ